MTTEKQEMPPQVPGRLVWADLMTTDLEAAQAFYGDLFGWEFSGQLSPGNPYVHTRSAGRDVGGMLQMRMAGPGAHPMWLGYFTVTDLDGALARVEASGGRLVRPVMDLANAGRLGVIADPGGGAVTLFQPNLPTNGDLPIRHGDLEWAQLQAADPVAAAAFYRDVLGWTTTDRPMGSFTCTVCASDGMDVAGIMPIMAEGAPTIWSYSFRSDDPDATVVRVVELGGSVLREPEDAPGIGRLATVADPQGVAFQVICPPQP